MRLLPTEHRVDDPTNVRVRTCGDEAALRAIRETFVLPSALCPFLLPPASSSSSHHFTSGQRVEEEPAVALGLHPAVEDHDDPLVGLGADQPAEALLELDDRLGDLSNP